MNRQPPLPLLLRRSPSLAAPRCTRPGRSSGGIEGARAFLEGELAGLSVDSEGRLRLGPAPRPLFDPEAPNAWCVARDATGVLYVGTGNDGRVVSIEGTAGSVLFDADELEVHAVAVGPDGRVYAGTSPDGAVYAIDAGGQGDAVLRSRGEVHLGPRVRPRGQPVRRDRRRGERV